MTGDELRALRERIGLTAEEWADLLGVHWCTVRRWESSPKPKVRGNSRDFLRAALAATSPPPSDLPLLMRLRGRLHALLVVLQWMLDRTAERLG